MAIVSGRTISKLPSTKHPPMIRANNTGDLAILNRDPLRAVPPTIIWTNGIIFARLSVGTSSSDSCTPADHWRLRIE